MQLNNLVIIPIPGGGVKSGRSDDGGVEGLDVVEPIKAISYNSFLMENNISNNNYNSIIKK